MTALDLLADFRRAGVELFADAGRLRFRAPAGAVTASMRDAAAARREELLALVALPDGWDATAAADAMRDCNAFLGGALTDASLTPPQRVVAEVLRDVVRTHAARHDLLLWDNIDFLTEKVGEWKALNADAARTHSPAPPQASFRSIPRGADWWATGDEPDLLALIKELFPRDGAPPKVEDWRSTRPGGRRYAPAP